MATAAPYLFFKENVHICNLDKDICTKIGEKMHHGRSGVTTRPKI